jgi:inorganic pyrophosphatase
MNPDNLLKEYEELKLFVDAQIKFAIIAKEKNELVNYKVVIEIPKNCQYKVEYDRGTYWVIRPLENYRHIPTAYGYIENTIGPNKKELDAIIYIPSKNYDATTNQPGIGYNCIPLIGLSGANITEKEELKIIVVPYIYFEDLISNKDELTEILIRVIFSLYINIKTRLIEPNAVFRLKELVNYHKINSLMAIYKS